MTENWHHLGGGFYLVRTQAGFRQAARHYLLDPADREHLTGRQEANELIEDVAGFPTSYPAVCAFSLGYRGQRFLRADCLHVNALLDGLRRGQEG